MCYCHENACTFGKLITTGQTSEQKIFSSPTPVTRRQPGFAIAFDEMIVQRRTVLISGAVFFSGKVSAMLLEVPVMDTELSGKYVADSAVQASASYAIDNAQTTSGAVDDEVVRKMKDC